MATQEHADGRHAALASDPRRRVLELLGDSEHPLDAAAVAAGIGLHVTTARFHLEQLEQAGLIRRLTERAGQRGRPRILFVASPAARAGQAQRELNQTLAGAFAEDSDGGSARAVRAGERWSTEYESELRAQTDGAVAPLVRVLDRLGFDPSPSAEREPVGEPAAHGIELRACPFREEARHNPEVVCAVHLGLLRGAARALGQDATAVELRPFVEPELCLVRLRGHWD